MVEYDFLESVHRVHPSRSLKPHVKQENKGLVSFHPAGDLNLPSLGLEKPYVSQQGQGRPSDMRGM